MWYNIFQALLVALNITTQITSVVGETYMPREKTLPVKVSSDMIYPGLNARQGFSSTILVDVVSWIFSSSAWPQSLLWKAKIRFLEPNKV